MDLKDLTIDSVRSAVAERKTSAAALAGAFYARIATDDPKIGSYLTLSKERAASKAAKALEQVQKEISSRVGCFVQRISCVILWVSDNIF